MGTLEIILIVIGALILMGLLVDIITRKKSYDKKIRDLKAELSILKEEIKEAEKSADKMIFDSAKLIENAKDLAVRYNQTLDDTEKMILIIQNNYENLYTKLKILADTIDGEDADEENAQKYIDSLKNDIRYNEEAIKVFKRLCEKNRGYTI